MDSEENWGVYDEEADGSSNYFSIIGNIFGTKIHLPVHFTAMFLIINKYTISLGSIL